MTLASPAESTRPLSLSVVIPNYNYAEFLRGAIDSALGLDWPDVEVIVVDDGSTDGSRAVIESYGTRVKAIFQANGGQTAACNAGFAASRGDVVIFLDSDDLLDPSLMRELAAVWRSGISKVQFQMKIVDAQGKPTGALLPQYREAPTPDQVRLWAFGAGAYPTPPGSGNAYARWFLEKICPLQGPERCSDSYYLSAAPYFGDVVTIAEPLVSYRIHGRNDSALSQLDVGQLARELRRARFRFDYARSVASVAGATAPDEAVFHHSLAVLPYRLASLRLSPEGHPIENDSLPRVLRHLIRACGVPQGVSTSARAALLAWGILVCGAPRPWAEELVRWRFVSKSRPQALRRGLRWMGVLRSATP